jgi:hypothetical protein
MVNTSTKLEMQILKSKFPFSKRMHHFFESAEIHTVEQLAQIPLSKFTCFRGFKIKCMEELIAFIEFEQLQDYFTK